MPMPRMKFRNSVPYKEIMDFLAKRGISINLFFYNQEGKELEEAEHRYKILRLFNARASLGGGAINDDELSYDEVVMDKKILRHFSNCSKPYPVDIISASGDSMHPYICDDDLCLIAVGMPYKDGDVCAINTPDGVVIKEIYRQGDEIMLISYNPIYAPIRYYACECNVIGVFAGLMRDLKPVDIRRDM